MFLRPLFLSVFLLTLGLLKPFADPIQLSASFPSDIAASKSVFDKCVEVFGLRVLATSGVSEAKTLHTANVLAEYLDNDEDGNVDQPEVLAALKGSSNAQIATMVLFASEQEQESKQSAFEAFENSITRAQNLFAMEIFENGSNGSDRDATLEEVLHLVTDKGWDEAFPAIWGEKVGSSIALAMDTARGGHYETIPSSYPPNAWYSYYDDTADYGTQITEYVFWATTTYLGAQDWPGRVHDDFTGEWKPYTRSMLAATDPAVVALLTSTDYKFPISKLPDGNYSPSSTSSSPSVLGAYVRADTLTDASSGWKQSSWFGNFFDSGSNWIYHENVGWLYPVDSGVDATWLYHPDLKWMWTKKEFYPWLYLNDLQGWRYFHTVSGVAKFYDANLTSWITFTDLAVSLAYAPSGTIVLGSFQGNSMGSLSSSDPEAATYSDLGIAGYGLTSPSAGDQAYANKWNAISSTSSSAKYKFNGFHKSAPLTANLGNKAFNGIKIRLKFKTSSSWVFGGGNYLRDIHMMHITIKQNDAVLRPEDDPNYGAGKGSADPNYTWGFVKVTPASASNYITVNTPYGWFGDPNGNFFDDYLTASDVPSNISNWNSIPRKFTFDDDYKSPALDPPHSSPTFQGNDIVDTDLDSYFESKSSTSLEAFPPHTQGISPVKDHSSNPLTFFEDYPTAIIIGSLALSKGVIGFGDYVRREVYFNYPDHLYTTARYLLTNDSSTGNSGSFTIWESDKVIPPGTEFKVTFARNIAAAGSAMHAGTQYYNPSLPYDCRLELIPQ